MYINLDDIQTNSTSHSQYLIYKIVQCFCRPSSLIWGRREINQLNEQEARMFAKWRSNLLTEEAYIRDFHWARPEETVKKC